MGVAVAEAHKRAAGPRCARLSPCSCEGWKTWSVDTDVWRLADYARQSSYSDPGRHAGLFDDVPPTIESVSAMSRNIVVHYRAAGVDLPPQSRPDVDLRWIEAILTTDQHRHHVPLDQERPVEHRVQGCCRDHSLLAIAALRHHDVPAQSGRIRLLPGRRLARRPRRRRGLGGGLLATVRSRGCRVRYRRCRTRPTSLLHLTVRS